MLIVVGMFVMLADITAGLSMMGIGFFVFVAGRLAS